MKDLVDFLAQMPNPLSRLVVSDRDVYEWSGEVPDVDSIHREAREALLGSVGQARRGRPHLLLLRGEGGDGKTHLLAWLRRQEPQGFLFCAVPPMPEPGEPFRHVLRHLMGSLRRPAGPGGPGSGGAGSATATPLAELLWGLLYAQACDLVDAARLGGYDGPPALPRLLLPLCEDGGAPRGAADFARLAQPLWAQIEPGLGRYLQGLPSEGPLDLALRSVLVQYPYADRRNLCVAWLAGEDLGDAELQRLHVNPAMSTEAAARRVLTALCRSAPRPMVLCYDQIEGMLDRLRDPGLSALSEVVVEVFQAGGATGQVIACHASVWPALLGKLQARLEGEFQEVQLGRITPEQVRDLMLSRLGAAFSAPDAPARPGPAYPFTEAELLEAAPAAGLRNARAALRHFEGEFERRRDQLVEPGQAVNASSLPPPTTDAGVVDAALARAAEQVRAGLGQTLPGGRAAQLRAVVRELCEGLQKQPRGWAGVQVTACDPILGGGLRLSVQVGGRAVRAALEISNADAGPALFSAAARLQRQVADGRAELALLLREHGLSLGGGVGKAGAVEAQLGQKGGVIWLSEDETVELLAVERVLHAASSRELSAGPRAIGRPEALALLCGRGEGPPAVLRRLLGRLRQPGADSGTAPDARPPSPSGRGAGGEGRTGTPPTLSPPSGPPPAVRSSRPPPPPRPTQLGLGVISVGPGGAPRPKVISRPPRPPEAAVPGGARQTLKRVPTVPREAAELTAQQVLQAIGARPVLDLRVLAQELGIAEDALPALLKPLEQQGELRVTVQGGVRVVVREAP